MKKILICLLAVFLLACGAPQAAGGSGNNTPEASVETVKEAQQFASDALDSAIALLDGVKDKSVSLDEAAQKLSALTAQFGNIRTELLSDSELKIKEALESADFVLQDLKVLDMTGASFEGSEELAGALELLKGLRS